MRVQDRKGLENSRAIWKIERSVTCAARAHDRLRNACVFGSVNDRTSKKQDVKFLTVLTNETTDKQKMPRRGRSAPAPART